MQFAALVGPYCEKLCMSSWIPYYFESNFVFNFNETEPFISKSGARMRTHIYEKSKMNLFAALFDSMLIV